MDKGPRVGEMTPPAVWDALSTDDNAVLVDVRTRAEWSFVGVPDLANVGRPLILCEWAVFPDMAPNPNFAETVLNEAGASDGGRTFFFICRSGVRSLHAAHAVAAALAEKGQMADCINVAEGFEGDLDAQGHRGNQNGWKHRGLAWRQS